MYDSYNTDNNNPCYCDATSGCSGDKTITECEISYDCSPIMSFSTYKTISAELEEHTNWEELSTHKLSKEFIEYYKDKLSWRNLLQSNEFDENDLVKYESYYDEKCKYRLVPRYQRLTPKYMSENRYTLDWDLISQYQVLSPEFMHTFREYINWTLACRYQHMCECFIENHIDRVSWLYICTYQKLSEEFINTHIDKVNWHAICKAQKLSEEFIMEHEDKVVWEDISALQKLSNGFVINFMDKLNLVDVIANNDLSEYTLNMIFNSAYVTDDIVKVTIKDQKLSEDFIRNQEATISEFTDAWSDISRYQHLSEFFIDEYADVLDWTAISAHQRLSEEFIESNSDRVDWAAIFVHQHLSPEFMEAHKNEI